MNGKNIFLVPFALTPLEGSKGERSFYGSGVRFFCANVCVG